MLLVWRLFEQTSTIGGAVSGNWDAKELDAQVVALFHDSSGALKGETSTYVSGVPAAGQKVFTIATRNKVPADWKPEFVAQPSSAPSQ